MVQVYNTLSGKKEVFVPLVPGQVRMYVCGVTVYDECHLGHARSALVFDVIRCYLEESGFSVTFVKNFTDVDDKIIARAKELHLPWQAVAATYIETYYRDMARLGVRPATVEPKATEHMAEIIELIKTLLAKGVAYRVDGDVYFQVEKYPAYGRLSKRKLSEMVAGARVEVDTRKRHPMDFALWKASKPGEPAWESPWGPGRPGWHIECSAMSMKHLGEAFDIHGGGADLIFPHHENEIAQSCAATGKEFARYWLHNGFVQVNHEKMSKSLGNFFTIREIFETWGYREEVTRETLRYFLLTTHYRHPLEFSDHELEQAKRALDGLYDLLLRLDESGSAGQEGDQQWPEALAQVESAFRNAMDDDFNTPVAIAQLQRLRGQLNHLLDRGLSARARAEAALAFRRLGRVVGLLQLSPKDWEFGDRRGRSGASSSVPASADRVGVPGLSQAEIERLIAERQEARQHKDFSRADAIRQTLAAQGIILEDRPDGTTRWKR
jgi:cysteinyl-tRNA synthetase